MQHLTQLSDHQLLSELESVQESLSEGLWDMAAEIRSERAAFGDSGPGTQAILDEVARAEGRLKELSKEWARRNTQVVVIEEDSAVPF